jgi:hypothetical protein
MVQTCQYIVYTQSGPGGQGFECMMIETQGAVLRMQVCRHTMIHSVLT